MIGAYSLKEFPHLPTSRKVLTLHTKLSPKNAYANCQVLYLLGSAIQNAIGHHSASQPTSAFFTQITQLCLRGPCFASVPLIPTPPTGIPEKQLFAKLRVPMKLKP